MLRSGGTSSSTKTTSVLVPPHGFVLLLPKIPMEPRIWVWFWASHFRKDKQMKESGAAKQQMDKSQQECPTVPGCLPENSSELLNKIKQKPPTKPNQNTSFAAKSCHCFQDIKESSTCRNFPEGPAPEFFPDLNLKPNYHLNCHGQVWWGAFLAKISQEKVWKVEINGFKEPFPAIFYRVHCDGGNNLT